MFTRVPVPGRAKTRLVPPLTPEQAAALQRAMTGDLLERLDRALGAGVPGAPARSLEVRYAGELSPGVLDIPAGWTVAPQGPGDLGARLRRRVRDAERENIARLVIIGADAPLLPVPLVEAAFSVLSDRDVVLGPAEDGGYVLIGVAPARLTETARERLFSGIPWGTGKVREVTRAAADHAGLRLEELPRHWDVDRPGDLPRLATEIGALDGAERPRRTVTVLAAAGF